MSTKNMNKIPTLYHGSSAGWLMHTGLCIQNIPYGEFSKPAPFLHLTTTFEAAEAAAWMAYRNANHRLKTGKARYEDYVYNGERVDVAPYVYTVELPVMPFVSRADGVLTPSQLSAIGAALRAKQVGPRGFVEFVKGFFLTKVNESYWWTWIKRVWESSSGDAETLEAFAAAVLFEAGIPLVRQMEEAPEKGGGLEPETWALSAACPAPSLIGVKRLREFAPSALNAN